ncbi:hypothetical protein QCA50_010998 [Cerrena zonata]|uniref:Uncharacterized protein n=1 Tax=Cerrena zonata TaxID=2478898 RepID=A0AAW0G2V0_9APHY
MNDPEDILSDALEAFYDYTPITHSSAGSLFTYTIPHDLAHIVTSDICEKSLSTSPSTITLKTPETQAANWSLHASSIWVSSLYMTDHLSDLHIDDRIKVIQQENRSPFYVLELGAGAGLPSIAISKLFEQNIKVAASDYPDDVLIQTLKENVDRNGASRQCSVIPHAWGTDVSSLLHQTVSNSGDLTSGFDLIIAADTLWNPDLHTPFLQTLQSTLRKATSSRIWIVAGLHTGRYTLRSFLDQLPKFGFEAETVEEREVKGNRRREWSVESGGVDEEKERRKWVVCMSIKWSDV